METDIEDHQQFSLKWNNHQSSVADALGKWFWSGSMADVTLVAAGESIKAHRLILASCSQYFADLFKDLSSEHSTIVVIVGCSPNELRLLLRFIYTGEVTADRQTLPGLLSLANTLRVTGLTDDNANLSEFHSTISETKDETLNTNLLNQYMDTNTVDYFSSNTNDIINQETISRIRELTQNKEETIDKLSKLDQIVQNLYSNKHLIDAKVPRKSEPAGGGVTCPICNKRLSNAYNLRVHAETHAGARHACTQCTHVSRSRDALRKHVAYRHQAKPRTTP